MRLTARHLDLLTEAFNAVMPLTLPADVALKLFFRDHRELGPRERSLIAETVFAALRRKRWLEALAPEAPTRRLALAALVKLAGISVRDLQALLSPAETKFLRALKAHGQPGDGALEADALAVRAEFPDWLVTELQACMSEADLLALAHALQRPAPLDLRVNTLSAERAEVQAALHAQGIAAQPTPFSPYGLRLQSKPPLTKNPLFASGKIEVQDEGSQLVAMLLDPKRGDMVVDFCAGAGGKTLVLGALMRSQGRLYAFDVSAPRLENLRRRLKRSGLSNVHAIQIENENDIHVKRLHGRIDRVLVDAPCTGLGTLRRNPDLKWRQTPLDLAELIVKQNAILAQAAKLLKPGGRLVYATCSFLRAENEDIVEKLLATHTDFHLLDAAQVLAAQRVTLNTGKYLQLSPQQHATDGFFAAVLARNA